MALQYKASIEIASAPEDRLITPASGVRFLPQTDIQVIAERRLWIFRPRLSQDLSSREAGGTYLSLPKSAGEGENPTYEERPPYDVNHFYTYLTWCRLNGGGLRINIMPTGPTAFEGSVGRFTGVVESVLELSPVSA